MDEKEKLRRERISKSLKEYHKSPMKYLKKYLRKVADNTWRQINDNTRADTKDDDQT